MKKNPLIDKLLSESIDEKINELTSKLDRKVNIMEIDAHDLEYEQSYELDNSKGKPKRVIFKGRGKKGKGDSTTQTYHFEDEKGHDFMLSGNGVKSKIKKTDSEMKKENEEFTEGNAFTKKLKDTKKGGEFKIGNKTYTDKSELEEKLYGGQKKLDKNKNNRIDAEDFKILRKGEMEEEMGGMEDAHPRFGKMNFSKMSKDNILNLLTKRLEDDKESEEDEFETEERLEEAKKFIQKAMNKMEKKGTEGSFKEYCGGEVTKSCIDKAMKSGDSKLIKKANFAKNIGGFKGDKHESITYRLKLTENTQIDMNENELVDFIEELVNEAKNNEKLSGTPKGMAEYKRVSKIEKKQNDDAIGQVTKKMKDYLKDGSKGEFEMNPKHFPKGNGELAKMDKKAYTPSGAVQDYTDNFTAAALENIDYDEIHPDEDWVSDNVKGSSRTGNNPEWANAVETPVNDKRNKIRKDNMLAKIKRKAYNKSAQPVVTDKQGSDKSSKLMMKLESTESKPVNEVFEKEQNGIIIEEFNKIMRLMNYGKKTQ
jgi:hypothetical protein